MNYYLSAKTRLQIENLIVQANILTDVAMAHARECEDENCDWCQSLCDQGLVESCDHCGAIEHTDAINFWTGNLVGQQMFIYCPNCV